MVRPRNGVGGPGGGAAEGLMADVGRSRSMLISTSVLAGWAIPCESIGQCETPSNGLLEAVLAAALPPAASTSVGSQLRTREQSIVWHARAAQPGRTRQRASVRS
jgi:hypothetical protein